MENSQLVTILEQLERDKGIDKMVLIEAVEAAVASAARKLWTVDKDDDIYVSLDPETGKLVAFAGDDEIKSDEFGRIAAQTAKQVVIQKIREAEKSVIYDEYQEKIGQIISGNVYRFDRGNVIVDLGKTEGIILRKELSPRDQLKQGDRVRAFVLKLDKEARGPQIILSRSHKNFVRRMFEMEVPEIYEGIVEIKSISRLVGERTKISVASKDEKVDSVGACVGMRGQRVKNIVNELQGEKIDIVRYDEDMKEYIQNALSPAEISQIQINYEDRIANTIVADDQLSLAIGRQGQNVRLASSLLGWELNIFSFDQWNQMQAQLEGSEDDSADENSETEESGVEEQASEVTETTEVADDAPVETEAEEKAVSEEATESEAEVQDGEPAEESVPEDDEKEKVE